MNYLGHSYFSKTQTPLFVTGNVLGDFYKGLPNRLLEPKELVEGVIFHRNLDNLTDENTYIINSKKSLIDCGLYNCIIIDIFTDYFFAKNWELINDNCLLKHMKNLYSQIDFSSNYLNTSAKKLFSI